MSQENIDAARTAIELFRAALKRGDPSAIFDATELFAPDFEWVPATDLPDFRIYHGRDEFAEFMGMWTEAFADWDFEIEDVIDAEGDRVVAITRQFASGRGSGTPVELRIGQILEFEAGRLVRVRNFMSASAALEAAGLSG